MKPFTTPLQKQNSTSTKRLWLLLCICVFSGSITGCITETEPSQRPSWETSHGGINGKATTDAYNGVNQLINRDIAEPDWNLASQGKFVELAESADLQARELLRTAEQLRVLSMQGVDPEIVNFANTFSEFFVVYASHINDRGSIARAMHEFDSTYKTAAALFEAFVRGAAGDPFGKTIEGWNDWKRIQNALTANKAESDKIVQGATNLGQRNAELKEYLRRTYGVK